MKETALLLILLTMTCTLIKPDRFEGSTACIDVSFQMFVEAVIPANFTVLVPFVEPKPVPVIVTRVPDVPESGDRDEIIGAAKTEPVDNSATNDRTKTDIRLACRIEYMRISSFDAVRTGQLES
jgi:hypothetical protein